MKSILILIVALTTTVSFTLKDGRPIATAYPIEFINIKPKSNLHHVDTKIKLSNDDYDCLARNIYFESGVES